MKLYRILQYIKHFFSANTLHGTHSPFVYKFIEETFYKNDPSVPPIVSVIRKQLVNNNTVLTPLPIGAKKNNTQLQTVKKTVAASSVTHKNGALLYRISNYLKPSTTLEFGTCFGLSTLYLALGTKGAVYTMEGDPERAKIALANFKQVSAINIKSHVGDFENILSKVLQEISQLDLVFIDGNHRYEPTLNYFNHCLQKSNHNTVFIFDDIHWSPEMNRAWQAIKNHDAVTVTIDTFYFGIVFLKLGQAKEHFRIKY